MNFDYVLRWSRSILYGTKIILYIYTHKAHPKRWKKCPFVNFAQCSCLFWSLTLYLASYAPWLEAVCLEKNTSSYHIWIKRSTTPLPIPHCSLGSREFRPNSKQQGRLVIIQKLNDLSLVFTQKFYPPTRPI